MRLPTGDEDDFLGAGATVIRGLGIVSARYGDFSPHFNGGVLITDAQYQNNRLLGTAGFDHFMTDAVTLAVDLVGTAHVLEEFGRVIAPGGQPVQGCDDQGGVTVDGQPLDEPYLYFGFGAGNAQESFPPVTVPEGHLWVMGDNRNNSSDSRRHVDDSSSGTIPVDNVIGKARAIVLPPSRWGGVSDHDPQAAAFGAAGAPTAPGWQSGLPAAAGVLLVGGTGLAVRRRRRR